MAGLKPTAILDEPKRAAITNHAEVVQQGQFYLAGGTALGLHLKHRLSRDLDWFTAGSFDGLRLAETLNRLPVKPTRVERAEQDTVRVFYGELETSFIRYSVVPAHPTTIVVGGVQLPIADLETIAAMKAGAVIGRGAMRDFIDIHALVRSPGWSMEKFVNVAEEKLGVSRAQLRLGLTYFADADRDVKPEGVTASWKVIKKELFRDVVAAFDRRPGPGIAR